MKKWFLIFLLLPSSVFAQNIGDVVYLKSGGPALTVTEIFPCVDLSGTDIGVRWFTGGNMMGGTFPATAITTVDPSAVISDAAQKEACRVLLLKDPAAKC